MTVNEEGGAQISYIPASSGPGLSGASCTSGSGIQCYVAAEPDVTAVLEGVPGFGLLAFSRNDGKSDYLFNYAGQLTSINDANGHNETFAYGVTTGPNCTAAGTACNTETDASGRVLDIVYTVASGLVSKVVDPAGRTWQFSYDTNNNLIGIENPRTYSETFGYDTSSANPTMVHDMTTLTLPNGQPGGPDVGKGYVVAYAESVSATAPLGYVISQTDPAGLLTTFSYAGDNMGSTGSTTITDPHGNVSQDNYLDGTLVSRINGVNTSHPETTSYIRNSAGMPTSVTDGNGISTAYSYDGNGNLLTSTDAQSHTWTYTYNQFNQLLTAVPPTGSSAAGPSTPTTAPATSRPQPPTRPTGSDLTTHYSYVGTPPAAPCRARWPTPNGHSTTFTYDAYGDVALLHRCSGGQDHRRPTPRLASCSARPRPPATHAGVACPTTPATRVAAPTKFPDLRHLGHPGGEHHRPQRGRPPAPTYDQKTATRSFLKVRSPSIEVNVFDADDRNHRSDRRLLHEFPDGDHNGLRRCPIGQQPQLLEHGGRWCHLLRGRDPGPGKPQLGLTAHYYDAFGNEVQTTEPGRGGHCQHL